MNLISNFPIQIYFCIKFKQKYSQQSHTLSYKFQIKRVTKFYGASSTTPTQISEGITYYMFKSFYHVLFCGGDLERALAFKDQENAGVDR